MDMRTIVGENVRHFRELRGITQEYLAATAGVSQQYISGLENGLRNPTIITVYEIAKALNVGHLDLLKPRKRK